MGKRKARHDRADRSHTNNGSLTRAIRRAAVLTTGVVVGELLCTLIDRVIS